MIQVCYFLSTVFGVGYLPCAPGTWGTMAGLTLSFLYINHPPLFFIALSLILFIVGFLSSWRILLETTDSDPSFIVIDEVAGFLLTVGITGLFSPLTPLSLGLSFLLFRFFDILKPWPIGWVEKSLTQSKKAAALGVMLDDMVAGGISGIIQISFLLIF